MIWFDLDNTPHVPVFRNVIKELESKGVEHVITARDFAQTKELLELFRIKNKLIGVHAGENKINKILNLFVRSNQLIKHVESYQPKLAVSHGSRTQLVAARRLRIKSLLMFDYEYTESRIFNYLSTYLLSPKFIPTKRLLDAGFDTKKLITYNGFKEELYLNSFVAQSNFRDKLRVSNDSILVVLRPPSMVGNYHDAGSEKLLLEVIKHFLMHKLVVILIINRTNVEKELILKNLKLSEQLRFLEYAVDGLQLLHAADFTISGGGTMNRESALLGTETYSIFTGRRPYLDEYLQEMNRLQFIENNNDIQKIEIKKKAKKEILLHSKNLVNEVTEIILDLTSKK